ncbi:MAG: MFS transporter [Deltaproteobacteria bacterium]|nr:MFS transporter [Deltaproteobacteria bacterium]
MKVLLLLLFWCLWFFNFSSRTILPPLLPVLENDLGISHTLSGSFFLYLSAGFTFSLLTAGWVAARLGYKKSIALATLVFAAALFFLRFADSYVYVSATCIFMGLGAGTYLPCAIPLLTSVFKKEYWGKALSLHETAGAVSFLTIPLLTALAMEFFTWKNYLLTFAGVCILSTLLFVIFAPDLRPEGETAGAFSRLFVRRVFWIIVILWCTASSSVVAVYNVTPLLLVNERGFVLETANTVLGISKVGGLVATFLAGFLVGRYGVWKILFVSLFFTGLTTIAIGIPQPFPLLMTSFILQSAFSMVFFPIGLVAISQITEPQERSHFTGGVAAASVIVGSGVVPFAVTVIGDIWSFQTGILLLGVFVMGSSLLLVLLKRPSA